MLENKLERVYFIGRIHYYRRYLSHRKEKNCLRINQRLIGFPIAGRGDGISAVHIGAALQTTTYKVIRCLRVDYMQKQEASISANVLSLAWYGKGIETKAGMNGAMVLYHHRRERW